MRVLIIEDDQRIAENIALILKTLDYISDIAGNADEGFNLLEINNYDTVVLDWMLPDKSGLEIASWMKEKKILTPILMLTAKSQVEDKLKGFEVGVDDYLTKPFVMEELIARIKALIRRKQGIPQSPIIRIKDIIIDTNSRQVEKNGKPISLSPKEYLLLEYLGLNMGKAIDRQELMDNVWGDEVDAFSNTVDVHIRYLRKKLGDKNAEVIKTVKNKGYMIWED